LPALGLIAFGPRTSTSKPEGRVVVTYWEKWTDFEGEAMRRLCAVFNETVGAEQGIYVDYVVTTQIELKTLVAAAGGDPPDLAGLWPDRVPAFASVGALRPLDEQAAAAGIDGGKILPVYYEPCRYHGRLWALPLTPWSLALYYNKGLLREFAAELAAAGYSPDQPPRTLAELAGYARIIHRRNARGEIELMGFVPGAPWPIGWYWMAWPLWFGGSLRDPADGRLRVDSQACVRAYDWVQDYAREYGFAEIQRFESSFANFNSPDNPFMIGKLAMIQQGPWFANMIRQYAPEIDYGAAPFPTVDGREVGFCGEDVLIIPAGAHHPAEAWAFIEWLYTSGPINVPSGKADPQCGYEYWLERTAGGPVRHPMPALRPIEWICWIHYKNSPLIDPSPEFLRTHPNPVVEVHERLARSEHAHTEPLLANWTELRSIFEAAYVDIWSGRAGAASRLEQCQERIDALSELARRRLARYGEPYP
jgi:multiple sugar transport system substrate-binding protein